MSGWQKCCRGRRSNCPQILIEGRTIRIRDDYGSTIKLTVDQLQDVQFKVAELLLQRSSSDADDSSSGLIP